MDLRKYGKPPKKVLSAEHALGIGKKKKPKKPKKSRKDKPKKGKPKKGKPKSILSKTLKRAVTTDQSLRNSTQQQFLENLHGRLNNNDGRTNGIWNSYKRNLTAQSFGGTPYELYRLREESDILREMLERATNDGRRRPQVSTTETQTETAPQQTAPQQTAPQQNQPTTPTTTPPPLPIRPAPQQSHLGFGQMIPARTIPKPQPIPAGGAKLGAMSNYEPQPIQGKAPEGERDFVEGWDDMSSENSDGTFGYRFDDDFTPSEQEQKKEHNRKEKQLRRMGDTSAVMPYMPYIEPTEYAEGSDASYHMLDSDSTDDPVSSSLGVNSFDDDEEEKAPPMPAGEEPEDEYDSGEEEPMSDSDDLIQLDDMEGDMADERDAYDFD
jgi:hypothetical protein